jgi:uncharacterized protein (TIGR02302 family)
LAERKTNDSPKPELGKTPLGRLERLVGFAGAALLWEKLWHAVIPPLLVVGLFVSLSFAGVWLDVGRPWRMIGVALFGLALAIAVLPFFRLRWPSRKQALARIDRSSGVKHNPASTLEDELANQGDPATRALWTIHRRRMMRDVAGLKAGAPSPRMVDFDRYALRAAVLVMLVASAFLAGPEKYARLAAAFDWREAAMPGASYRIDAWIDPPDYTGKPPVMLSLSTDQPQRIAAPINSTVIVRASGGDIGIETEGGLEAPIKADSAKPPETSTGDSEQRLLLRGDAKLGLKHAGSLVAQFDIAVIPDRPPQIELTDAPRANARGSLSLSYKIGDDYGVTAAEADFTDPSVEGTSGNVRSLVPPPHLALPLPAGPGGLGETEATVDLSDHPWAGARVKMTLTAHDGGGNVGKSDPIEITLPQRPFVKPIARALVEQRRNLVLFPESRERVQTALDALMIAPETFEVTSSVYLGLSVASSMLQDAQNDADLLAVADYLWNMALEIENGSLSDAERDLRAAEQQLREALQRNAPQEEIRKLTENLRAAMDKFLNEFAEQQARELGNQQQPAERAPNPSRSVSRKDLQSMLDRMQEMARAGDRSDAQRMLEQLQNTLENLQMAKRRDADPTTRAMNQALRDLDKLTREQQQLRDETNRQAQAQDQAQEQQDESDDQQQGQPNQAPPQSPNDQAQNPSGKQSPMSDQELHDRQQALRNRLEEVERQLKQMGQDQSALSEAQKAMKDAENALSQEQNQGQQQGQNQGQNQGHGQSQGGQGQGQSPGGQEQGQGQGAGNAVGAQGRALQALRKGADQLAQSMQQGGEGQGAEGGNQPGDQEGAGQANGGGDTDPLGRPLGNDPAFDPHARFDPMGIPAAQRAQRVLEELRRRLSDPSRSKEELDYLERLLNPY